MNYKKYILTGIPALFIIGSIFHYIYAWSNNNIFIGLISPINESIWEHLKLVLLPMTIYWLIYLVFNKNINKEKWLTALVSSIIITMLTIICFYYTYTGALGIELLILDIFSLLLGLTIGQLFGMHIYTYTKSVPLKLSIVCLISIFLVFIIFTLYTPNLPIFISKI